MTCAIHFSCKIHGRVFWLRSSTRHRSRMVLSSSWRAYLSRIQRQSLSHKLGLSTIYPPRHKGYKRVFNRGERRTQEDQQDELDRAMAWKRLRPSALRTVCQSMYIGALISLLTATIIGSVYTFILYLCYKTINNCEFNLKKSIPLNVQWMRSISTVISYSILQFSSFVSMLFLFRPYQLMGVKTKLMLVSALEVACKHFTSKLCKPWFQAVNCNLHYLRLSRCIKWQRVVIMTPQNLSAGNCFEPP